MFDAPGVSGGIRGLRNGMRREGSSAALGIKVLGCERGVPCQAGPAAAPGVALPTGSLATPYKSYLFTLLFNFVFKVIP